jgi:WD domain, G-beta repeat
MAARFRDSDLAGQRTRRILDAKSPDWRRAWPAEAIGDKELAKNEADEPTTAFAAAEPRSLMDDADLRTVERGLNATRILDESEKSLVDASREAREKRMRRSRFWKRLGAVAIAAITMLSGIVTWQWREATIQTKRAAARARVSRALYASSEAQRIAADEPTLGLLLSAEAMRSLGPNDPALPDPERALRSALRSPARQVLRSSLFNEERLVISSHKRWLAAAGFGGPARIWDLSPGPDAAAARELQGFEGEHSISCLVVSPNDQWLASGSDWGARLWRIKDGAPEGGAIELAKDSVKAVAFSRDGRWLATAGDKVHAWKLEGSDHHLRVVYAGQPAPRNGFG